jgi:hypothetical protein
MYQATPLWGKARGRMGDTGRETQNATWENLTHSPRLLEWSLLFLLSSTLPITTRFKQSVQLPLHLHYLQCSWATFSIGTFSLVQPLITARGDFALSILPAASRGLPVRAAAFTGPFGYWFWCCSLYCVDLIWGVARGTSSLVTSSTRAKIDTLI